MEERGELVTGAMLSEKRARFEKQLNVPDAERLMGDRWIASFCRTCSIFLVPSVLNLIVVQI